MMTIKDKKKKKKELGLTNQKLAEKSGIPLATVAKVLSLATKSPRISTLAALEKALTDNCARSFPEGQYPTNMESADSPAQEPSGEYLYGNTAQKQYGSLQKADPSDKSAGLPAYECTGLGNQLRSDNIF